MVLVGEAAFGRTGGSTDEAASDGPREGDVFVQQVLIPPQGLHWSQSPGARFVKLVAFRP